MKTECRNCGQPIEYQVPLAGTLVTCPGCEQVIELPQFKHPPAKAPADQPAVRSGRNPDWLKEFMVALCGLISLFLMGGSLVTTPTAMMGVVLALWAITFAVFGVIMRR